MRPRASRVAGLLLLLLLPASAGAQDGPRAVVEQTVADVIAVLNDEGLSSDVRATRIETIAYARFDFATMSRLVLARNWKRLDAAQQKDFEAEFKRFLANNYRARIDGYEQEQVEILGEREEPRGDVTVRTRIVGGEFDGTNVDYRLRKRNGPWLVIDVVIEGISLVSNYRDQFREVIGQKGPAGLLETLRAKNAEVDAATES